MVARREVPRPVRVDVNVQVRAAEDRLERASVVVGQIRDGLDLGTGASLADEVADLYDVHGVPR